MSQGSQGKTHLYEIAVAIALQMKKNLQAYPDLNLPGRVTDVVCRTLGVGPGSYVGFCLEGVPDGPGNWTGEGFRCCLLWYIGREKIKAVQPVLFVTQSVAVSTLTLLLIPLVPLPERHF